MTEEKKKPGRKPKVEMKAVYCLASSVKTSKGPVHHGDTVDLPISEANDLIAKGAAK